MSLDKVRYAKGRGWHVIVQSYIDLTGPNMNDETFYVLYTPNALPIQVPDIEGYGITWGDYTEQEAWARLPVDV